MNKILSYSGAPAQKSVKEIAPGDIECISISIGIGFNGTMYFPDGQTDQRPQTFALDIPVDIVITPEMGQMILSAVQQAIKIEIKDL